MLNPALSLVLSLLADAGSRDETSMAVHYAFPYTSPRYRTLTAREAHTRKVAYELKLPKPRALEEASAALSAHVQPGSILVPVPSSSGSTEVNRLLAEAIASKSGAWVHDLLSRRAEVPSSQQRYVEGRPGLSVTEHSMVAHTSLPDNGAPVFLVDNVCTTGNTLRAAHKALGSSERIAGLVWAYNHGPDGRRYDEKARCRTRDEA